jgi:hypothetical protein
MKYYASVALFFAMIFALFGAGRAMAQDVPAITVEVQAGYDGAYRLGEWFPVVVTIANDGPDVRGVLEWRFAGRPDEPAFQRPIDLPRGSRKRVTLDVYANDLVRSGQLRLLDGALVLDEQTTPLEAVDQGRFLILVVSSDAALLNSLNSIALPAVSGATVRHLDVAALPESAASLRGVNALFLHDVDTAPLSQAQRDALARWVQVGGQLVVSGGGGGQRTVAGLADLLPADVTGEVSQGDLGALGTLAEAAPPPVTGAALSVARPRATAESLPPEAALLFRWPRGAGAVTFTTFDLAGLRGWDGEPRLWGRLLAPLEMLAPGFDARQRRLNLLQSSLRLPSLGLPSAVTLFCFLIGYIFVIGPLNYLMLRRLRRLEWAWMTVPAAVLLFATGLYIIGFGGRGGQSQISQIAVVQGSEGDARGFVTSFVGLFSPRRASYTLGFPPETLISEVRTFNDLIGDTAIVRQGDAGAEVPDVLVDVGSVRTFMAEGAAVVPLSVQSDLSGDQQQITGEIRNAGSQPLEDVLVVRGSAFQSLGTIAPGASRQVSLGLNRNFPWGVNMSRSGLFERQQILSALFEGGPARFGNPNAPSQPIDERGVYLLAWSSEPSVLVHLDGNEASQDGLTLYIIRLNDAAGLPLTILPTALPTPTLVESTPSLPTASPTPTPILPTPTPIDATPSPALSPTQSP